MHYAQRICKIANLQDLIGKKICEITCTIFDKAGLQMRCISLYHNKNDVYDVQKNIIQSSNCFHLFSIDPCICSLSDSIAVVDFFYFGSSSYPINLYQESPPRHGVTFFGNLLQQQKTASEEIRSWASCPSWLSTHALKAKVKSWIRS